MSNLRRFENPTEGTAPAPERLLPTRPGWWLEGDPDDPSFVEVCEKDDVLVGLFPHRDRTIGDPYCKWLAEVPPPDVCAAWAAAGKPSAAVLAALGEYDAARRQIVDLAPVAGHSVAKPGEGPAAVERFKAARDSLNIALGLQQFAAIRAERATGGDA